MKKMLIELENCHGIKKLCTEFDFRQHSAYAIYAPNGTMKTSLAHTFHDLAENQESHDMVFRTRKTKRRVVDETDVEIDGSKVVVIASYDEELGMTEEVSTLLVNSSLRKQYEKIHAVLEEKKDDLLQKLKKSSKTRLKNADIEEKIQKLLIRDGDFFDALMRIKDEIINKEDARYASVPYDRIFNPKVRQLFQDSEFQKSLKQYVNRLNELLDSSDFFSRDSFSYYNAENVKKTLEANGFFKANHSVLLRNKKSATKDDNSSLTIENDSELEELINSERNKVSEDAGLRKKFQAVEKKITKNSDTRDFYEYISSNPQYLPELIDIDLFEEKTWKSYIKINQESFLETTDFFESSREQKKEIEEEALRQETKWEKVIDIFNNRFYVPFTLTIKNRIGMVLGQEKLPQLSFDFSEGEEHQEINKTDLLSVLSTGEKKALYILNVLFEMEERKSAGEETVFVVDDIADSFDYKNKYAIIQYLKEMSEVPQFRLILLTHNFDFFRTVDQRGVVSYKTCKIAYKTDSEVRLEDAKGINNPFINDFKKHFFDDSLKRVASVPFIRNLIEYTRGVDDRGYNQLTSLLHWKSDTSDISQKDLDDIFNDFFGADETFASIDNDKSVVQLIFEQAKSELSKPEGPNLESKLVLSVAIRLKAEKYMISCIADSRFVSTITKNQTYALFKKFSSLDDVDEDVKKVISSAVLMTPESIHVNAFMYEPIIDLSDVHLKQVYKDLLELSVN